MDSGALIEIRRLGFVLIETDGLELGKNSADKNLRFDAERDPVGVIGNPYRRAPEFPMRLEVKVLADPLELEIDLDGVECSGANRHTFAADHCHRC